MSRSLTTLFAGLALAAIQPWAASPALGAAAPTTLGGSKCFAIVVVDDRTGRGVPLVELRTVHHVRRYTDSNGVAAFHEPGLMGHTVFFHVRSHGYEFPKDGFGYRGKALKVTPGGTARLKLRRINIAQRLYRLTGAGIYRDSVLVGHRVPTREPTLNGRVLGSDSVMTALFRGKVYWFWGDTNRPGYPLGNFHVPGATSLLPQHGGLDPAIGVNLSYFLGERGFAKGTARMPGKGPTWISGLVALRDKTGRERMFAAYVKVRGFLEVYQRGLVEFNDETKLFQKVAELDLHAPAYPRGHPLRHTVGGIQYIYFADPYPLIRVRAHVERLTRIPSYEAFTCLKTGTRLSDPQLDRGPDGHLRYAWRTNTPPVGPRQQARLIKAGLLKADEALLQLRDADTDKPVAAHRGSVHWNAWRHRWILIACEVGGTSHLGELWYAEADAPVGPWVYARKIVTHQKYSFYNPKHHPMFDKDGGRTIFFEGTYTTLFSGNSSPTPRYDYNQIMYQLDLADPRLALPVPVYRLPEAGGLGRFRTLHQLGADAKDAPIAFFALDRPVKGTVPVHETAGGADAGRLRVGPALSGPSAPRPEPLFYALPASGKPESRTVVPLFELVHTDGQTRAYAAGSAVPSAAYRRRGRPLCLVWRSR